MLQYTHNFKPDLHQLFQILERFINLHVAHHPTVRKFVTDGHPAVSRYFFLIHHRDQKIFKLRSLAGLAKVASPAATTRGHNVNTVSTKHKAHGGRAGRQCARTARPGPGQPLLFRQVARSW
jgi:hypothetical protein